MTAPALDPAAEAAPDPSSAPAAERPRRRPWLRLLALAVVLVGMVVAGHASGVTEGLTVDAVRARAQQAGPLGVVSFLVVFCVGELLHVPGLVFVAAGVLAYGQLQGGVIGFVGALLSVSFSFWVVRTVGGSALAEIERPWIRRALARLESRPVLTVAILRTVFQMSPPLNYALALTPIRFGQYLAGSALGLVLPMLLAVFFFESLLRWIGAT